MQVMSLLHLDPLFGLPSTPTPHLDSYLRFISCRVLWTCAVSACAVQQRAREGESSHKKRIEVLRHDLTTDFAAMQQKFTALQVSFLFLRFTRQRKEVKRGEGRGVLKGKKAW